MPKRKDLKKILVVGAGPIIIGQACEFDYSGTQACKALRDEGYKVVLINSNPATIMTDPDVADKTYIEPITLEVLEKILKKEKPNAILPTVVDSVSEKSSLLTATWASIFSVTGINISTNDEETLLTPITSIVGLDPKTPDVNGWDLVARVIAQQSCVVIVPSRRGSRSSSYVSSLLSSPNRTATGPAGSWNN